MTGLIVGMVAAGAAVGRWLLPPWLGRNLDAVTTAALGLLVFGVGIDIGRNREAWQNMRRLGLKVLLVPAAVAAGSIAGAVAAGMLMSMPANTAGAVGAGFGWYSLSGLLLAKIDTVETGALAFLANVFREVLAMVLMPVLARHAGKVTAIAPGGATTMDTTLPLIVKCVGPEVAMIAFVSGVILTLAVPVLVPLLINW